MTEANRTVPKFRRPVERWCYRTRTSQSDLARRIGLDPSTLSLIMSGKRGLSMSHAMAIHRETCIPVEKLLDRSDLQLLRDYLAEAKTEVAISEGNV